ncbi:MAG TPA: carbon starvation protein A [Candidatus Hydrogenedentes bacterium]|nr:carbon starvation protein A [Candidatus Hydrogenedentota bacterium]
MTTVAIAVLCFIGYIVAYHTYGRWLARKIFALNPDTPTPSHTCQDGRDYVPTNRMILFGHHFTSIAGTGPIVGPAIAVFWGWLPALLWVVLGSIFIGAVHDFGALVVSMRHGGQTIGDISGQLISKRTRLLFLAILFLTLTIVIAVFGLVIATIFSIYPETVLSVWTAMPLAILVGFIIYKRGGNLFLMSGIALAVLYLTVFLGVRYLPFDTGLALFPGADASYLDALKSSVVLWTLVLLVYCFFASVLPVWLLLQPRDYINSLQLYVALCLLVVGLFVAAPPIVGPALGAGLTGAPPIMPFLFITIACGAISGFHSVVSSGTSSKQIDRETDAQYIGYGSMLMESVLALLVILSCCAGIGILVVTNDRNLTGTEAFMHFYGHGWASMGLRHTVGVFIEGGGNLIASLGIPRDIAIGIIAVMVSCFAATTIDTSTRLQRYVIQEIGGAVNLSVLKNRYIATTVAVACAGTLALMRGPSGPGSGGLVLWPLFGATNQLLAGLALLVVVAYLRRIKKPVFFVVIPLLMMLIIPAWALMHQISTFYTDKNYLLVGFGTFILMLQVWMVIEAVLAWRNPPAETRTAPNPPANLDGGRAC